MTDYPEWFAHAACTGVDPELFHPSRGESTAEAKAICRRCGIRSACLEWAMATHQQFGIWGGLSEQQRKVERSRRRMGIEPLTTCACCAEVFRPRRRNQRYCSADCRQFHRRSA